MRSIIPAIALVISGCMAQADTRDFGEWRAELGQDLCAIWTETQIGIPSRMVIVTTPDGHEAVGFTGPDWTEGGVPFFETPGTASEARVEVPGLDTHIDVKLTRRGAMALHITEGAGQGGDELLDLIHGAAAADQTMVVEGPQGAFGIYASYGLIPAQSAYQDCVARLSGRKAPRGSLSGEAVS
jgi:hypothetical protein